MKKFFLCFICFVSVLVSAGAQHDEKECRRYFDENREINVHYGFEAYLRLVFKYDYTFTIDGFDYHFCDGTYSLSGNTIKINYPFNYIDEKYIDNLKDFGLNCYKASEIKIDVDARNLFNKGAYVSGDKTFWSFVPSELNREYVFNGVNCIKVNLKIRINENLKMRKTPSLKGEALRFEIYDYEKKANVPIRSVVYGGEEYEVFARSKTADTVDGLKAPWYLICVTMGTDDDCVYKWVWVFGGYVTVLE